ncbi:hypothetical protein WN943_022011 [Citrus x changshan-huyou]
MSSHNDACPCPSNSNKKHKPFEIKKWNPVAFWQWDIVVDTCAICRNHIMELCKHRVSSESSQRYQPGLHGCLGFVQSRLSLPLHQPMAQDSPSVPFRFVLRTLITSTFIDITVCGNTKSMGTRALQEATSGAAAVGSISH